MCGIYGSTIPYDDFLIKEKLLRINFRGPDFSAFERNEDIILGHNRLSIIDLDERSNQPLAYQHLKIVFNGEIYNYQEIKNDLLKNGYHFHTNSDTEVICAAYLEYGEKCLSLFNGMFAFVIYDDHKKKLFGARDRLGKKPFYYYLTDDGFEFASQPSAISLGKNLTVNNTAIEAYLHLNCIPDSLCIYNGIKKLKAGHYFTYCIKSAIMTIKCYWDIDYSWADKFKGTYDEAKEILTAIINDSVKIRLNADVPLGIFLSSGIDSSLIAGIASGMKQHVKTFNIKFNEIGFDESHFAKSIASHFNTDHHIIECNYRDGIDLIDNHSYYYDEPFADSSAIPLMLMAKYTKSFVTVALSGDGGDESFLGYKRYQWINKVEPLYTYPSIVRKSISWFLSLSPNYRHKLIAMGLQQQDIASLYMKIVSTMDNSWLLNPECTSSRSNDFILKNDLKPLLERVSDYDTKTYLNDDINTKVDRATMAYGLEARAPLMDYRIIEFANRLPSIYKLDNKLGQKRILKDILYEKISPQIYNRPKSGFTVPLKTWFRNELKEYVLDNLNIHKLQDIPGIKVAKAMNMIDMHIADKANYAPQIWSLLILNQWLSAQKNAHPVEAFQC
jgi:asparagine synthase (glutamine-hydrolysing)